MIPAILDVSLFDIIDDMERDSRKTRRVRPPVKRVRDTSIEAFKEVLETLGHRNRTVLVGLNNYIAKVQVCPTAYELFEWLKLRGEVRDLNSVRPRLTNLCEMGMVVMTTKRKCTVTGKTVYAWRLPKYATVDWMKGTVRYGE